MKIVILGAGQVGSTLAERLSFEKNDITLVDASKRRLKQLPDLDVDGLWPRLKSLYLARSRG